MAVLLGVALLGVPEARARAVNPHLARGIRLLDQAEDEKALVALQQALAWPGASADERASAHFYLGVTYYNLHQPRRAEQHFRGAFELAPRFSVPADLSPKILQLVEQLRPKAGPPPPPPRRPGARPPAPPPGHHPVPPRVNWPAWVTLGLAAAAAGSGLGLSLAAQRDAGAANDLSLPHDEAQGMYDSAGRYALSANILFGVAGAALVASGVLFLVRRPAREPGRAGIIPVRGGAVVQVGGVCW